MFDGKLVKELRLSKGLSRQTVVNMMRDSGHSIVTRTLLNWEHGDNLPTANDLEALAKVLGCAIPFFYL